MPAFKGWVEKEECVREEEKEGLEVSGDLGGSSVMETKEVERRPNVAKMI